MLINLMQSNSEFRFSKLNLSRLALSISLAITIYGLMVFARDGPDKPSFIQESLVKTNHLSVNKFTTSSQTFSQAKSYQQKTSTLRTKLKRFIKKQQRHLFLNAEISHFKTNTSLNRINRTQPRSSYSIKTIDSEGATKSNKKRCRYSDNEIDGLRSPNEQTPSQKQHEEQHFQIKYAEQIHNLKTNNYKHENSGLNYVKQPRVRDQNNRPYHFGPNGFVEKIESEKIFVNIGETINLTCQINTKEVDWHFKDKNLTTTVITNGLQLLVIQPIIYDFTQQQQQQQQLQKQFSDDEYQDSLNIYRPQRISKQLLKYKVSSDRQSSHMLTLYIQGNQDEGSYQCVDSSSETPIKKTIRVILKNNSMALTSGFSAANSSFFFYFVTFIFIWSILNNDFA